MHISLLGPSRTAEWEAEFGAAADRCETAEEYLVWSYVEFLERYRDRFAQVFEAIAHAPEGRVVVHCMGGKDRTGLIVALALRLSGWSVDDIVADYALSEANLSEFSQPWVDAAPTATERRRRELLVPTPPSAMRACSPSSNGCTGAPRAISVTPASPRRTSSACGVGCVPLLELRDVEARYGQIVALRGVSLTVEEGASSRCSARTARGRRRLCARSPAR